MREWSIAAQHGLLLYLASMHDQHESAEPFNLWHVRKGERQLRCVAVYLPSGFDLRLFEGATSAERNSAKKRPRPTRSRITGAPRSSMWGGRRNSHGLSFLSPPELAPDNLWHAHALAARPL